MSRFRIKVPSGAWIDPSAEQLRFMSDAGQWVPPKEIYQLEFIETRYVNNDPAQPYTHYEWGIFRQFVKPDVQHPVPSLVPADYQVRTLESWLIYDDFNYHPYDKWSRTIEYEFTDAAGFSGIVSSGASASDTRDEQFWNDRDRVRARMCWSNEAGQGPWSAWTDYITLYA